jgi:hypothetical protein
MKYSRDGILDFEKRNLYVKKQMNTAIHPFRKTPCLMVFAADGAVAMTQWSGGERNGTRAEKAER